MTYSKSFAVFDRQKVIDRVSELLNVAKNEKNEASQFFINREIKKSLFWNKISLGFIKVKTLDDLNGQDIYTFLSMAECWFYSDLISNQNYYTGILRLALESSGNNVYLTTDDAKIFKGK